MPHMQSVTFGLWAGVGGRHEPKQVSGISHFMEHMLFKGTRRRTARQIGQEVESVGGYLNATTTHDHTVYYGAAPANQFRKLTAVLCDMYSEPRFSAIDIKKERSVIAEEILMYQDEPSELVQEMLWEDLWPNHGLGRPLTGTLESIGQIHRDDFLKFKENYYHAGNTVVSAAGLVHHDDVVARVDSLLGSLPKGRKTSGRGVPVFPDQSRMRIDSRDTQQTHVAFGVPACDLYHDDRYAITLLNVLLAGNMSSRLFQELREKRGLCYSVSSSVSHYSDTGVLNFYIGLDAKNLPLAMQLIGREFARLRNEPVKISELKRAKDYTVGSARMSLERSTAQSSRLGYSVLFYGDVVDPETVHERLMQVTPEEIQRVAERSLRPERVTLSLVGPVPSGTPVVEHMAGR
jgi:predicted Zn-dependent peptidase